MPTPVDVAGAGAVVVAAVEVAADGAAEDVLADTVVVAAVEVVADPPEVVLGVHPASEAAIATRVSIAASPGRAPDPGPMAGRYSRAVSLSGSREGPNLRHRAGFEKLRIQALTGVLPMDLTVARCFVTVTDPDKALAFYRDVLGLELVMDVPNGDYRWITVGSKSQPGVQIVLSNYIQGSPDDLVYVAGLVAKGALNAVHFRTDDLDGLFVKLAEAGAEIVSEPTSQPWGARDGAVRDPSGNLIRIDQA